MASPAIRGRAQRGGLNSRKVPGCTHRVRRPQATAIRNHTTRSAICLRVEVRQPHAASSQTIIGTTTAVGLAKSARANAPVASQ